MLHFLLFKFFKVINNNLQAREIDKEEGFLKNLNKLILN